MEICPGLLVERSAHHAAITIDRPQQRNALNTEILRALTKLSLELTADDMLRVVTIRGAGTRAFISGMDLRELAKMSPQQAQDHFDELNACLDAVAAIPVPVVCAIQGYAMGGGCELASACDIRIATTTSTFGFPIGRIGHNPDRKSLRRLARLIKPDHLKLMVFTDTFLPATEMQRLGFLHWTVPDLLFEQTLDTLVAKIITQAPRGLRALKQSLSWIEEGRVEPDPDPLADPVTALWSTRDFHEGVAAFLEHRQPRFEGR